MTDKIEPKQYINPKEAADYLDVSEATLRRWRFNGIPLKFIRLTRQTIRYRYCDLDEFMESKITVT